VTELTFNTSNAVRDTMLDTMGDFTFE